MAGESKDPEALRAAFATAGLDPTGIDLAWLAEVKDETERKIVSYRSTPGFAEAIPAFNPPTKAGPPRGGIDGAA